MTLQAPTPDFEKLARQKRPSFAREWISFLGQHKKWWLAPIVVAVLLLGLLVLFGGSAAMPFVYTLF